MSSVKEKNSVWYFLLLLPIASSVLTTIGGFFAVIGAACLVLWFMIFRGSLDAFNSGKGKMWQTFVPFISQFSKGRAANSSNGSPSIPQNSNPVIPPQAAFANAGKTLWDRSAPAYSSQRLTATLESLKWNNEKVNAITLEAGENLQYALAFRCQHGNLMAHSQRIDSIQMSELAAHIKGKLPQNAACRAWPMLELSKGINMDGLLAVPDRNKPLGLYLIIAGDQNKSRFTVFSMFVPVCTGKADWIKRIYQPSPEELKTEKEFISAILKLSEQIVS